MTIVNTAGTFSATVQQLMKDKRYLEEQGLRPTFLSVGDGSKIIGALLSGCGANIVLHVSVEDLAANVKLFLGGGGNSTVVVHGRNEELFAVARPPALESRTSLELLSGRQSA